MSDEAEFPRLQKLAARGRAVSRQSSYSRGAPRRESIVLLCTARDGLRLLVQRVPTEVRAWRLLSEVLEALLDCHGAIETLEKVMLLERQRKPRDLKRLALLQESAKKWAAMPLSPYQVEELLEFLRKKLVDGPGERSFRWTVEWLRGGGVANPEAVLRALEDRGAFSDFQVLDTLTGT